MVVGRDAAYGDPVSNCRTAARRVEVEVVQLRFREGSAGTPWLSHEQRIGADISGAAHRRAVSVAHPKLDVISTGSGCPSFPVV